MIDITLVRKDPDFIARMAASKGVSVDVARLVAVDERRRELDGQVAEVNRERKEAAASKDVVRGRTLKEKLAALEEEQGKVMGEFESLLLSLPNIPSEDTPVGPDESANVVVRSVGEPKEFSFKPKDHVEIGEMLGLIDTKRAAKVSGTRFGYFFGDAVRLQFAIVQFALDVLQDEKLLAKIAKKAGLKISPKPFVPVIPPVFIQPEIFARMARLEPKDERYYIPSDDQYLVGSAEHTLGPLHLEETLKEEDLPIRYAGYSTSFRREAGSYGKDTHGMLRVHQFDKLEMESFTAPENGLVEQDFFVAIQEYLVSALELPYRVVLCSTGDQGSPDARHLDIEIWMPGEGKYRETHSADYMTDYQSRRLRTRVKRANGEIAFVHMNDATVFAIGRTLIAILENGQQKDGTVAVPSVLRPYVGKEVIGAPHD